MDYIVIGLGNPGKKYENTRHNAGFIAIDEISGRIDKIKFKSLTDTVNINGKKVLLLKPQTYMNLSGEAVLEAMNFYKVDVKNIIVIVDDISLPVGKIRIRKSGSHGGQNGLKNISELIKSNDYTRIKIGVGAKPHPDYNLADWVLSNFTTDEKKQILDIAKKTADAVALIIDNECDKAMSKYN